MTAGIWRGDRRPLHRATWMVLAIALTLSPWTARSGHDQVEDDLTYFLPISAERTKQLLDAGETIWFIDLRSPAEYKRQHLPRAQSIPLKELSRNFEKIPKSGRVVLYCGCPEGKIEEGHAYQVLRGFGYRNISVLEGGFSEWIRLGYPVETEGS